MSLYTDLSDWYVPLWSGDRFEVVKPVIWYVGHKDSGLGYAVPVGFEFDVSVPFWAKWIFSPTDRRFLKAACLHDHMLIDGWDRTTAAGIFNDALRADGVGRAMRLVMFLAVVLFKWR